MISGQSWAAATTEGLIMYQLDLALVFDPLELKLSITPDTVQKTLQEGDYSKGT